MLDFSSPSTAPLRQRRLTPLVRPRTDGELPHIPAFRLFGNYSDHRSLRGWPFSQLHRAARGGPRRLRSWIVGHAARPWVGTTSSSRLPQSKSQSCSRLSFTINPSSSSLQRLSPHAIRPSLCPLCPTRPNTTLNSDAASLINIPFKHSGFLVSLHRAASAAPVSFSR